MSVTAASRSFEVANLEVLKWLAVLCMLVDHFFLYAVEAPNAVSEAFGALALPLFVVAFAAGLGRAPDFLGSSWRALERIAVWALVAQIALLPLQTVVMFNVLVTFALGLVVFIYVVEPHSWGSRVIVFALALASAQGVEFQWFGVGLVFSALWYFRFRSHLALAIMLVLVGALVPYNGSLAACLAVVVVPLVALLPRDLPRRAGVFYVVYVAQFPLLWALRGIV